MSTHHPDITKPRGNKYDTIQVFRFIAALMVLILHSTFYASERLQAGFPRYSEGYNGVGLFFTISGFVMILSSENLLTKAGGWKIFAIKRIIRIVPIYWIITTYKLLLLIFTSSLVYHAALNPAYILKSYFFIPAKNVDGELSPLYGVGWTLNFEMFFYLLFTLSLVLKLRPIVFLSAIFVPLSVLAFYKTASWPDVSFYTNTIVLNFLYGMIAAKLILMNKKLPQNWSVFIIAAGLLFLFFPKMGALPQIFRNGSLFNGIATFWIVFAGASIEKFWDKSIPNWLIYLGGASYSLYLIHPSVAPIAPALLKHLHLTWPAVSVLLSVIIAIAGGTIFYQFCEKPLTNFITKWCKTWKII